MSRIARPTSSVTSPCVEPILETHLMNVTRTLLGVALVAALAACHRDAPAPTAGSGNAIEDNVAHNVGKAMADAQRKLETENITIRSDDGATHKAEITPKGDLLIDGKAIALNASQRAAVLDYREQTVVIAHAGMDVGVQGAKLATKAVTEAIGGIFSGHPDQIEKRVQAQADGIKQAASALCDKLPALQAAQQRVAAEVPEFAPFATIEQHDTTVCKRDLDDDSSEPATPATPAPPPPTPSPVGSTT